MEYSTLPQSLYATCRFLFEPLVGCDRLVRQNQLDVVHRFGSGAHMVGKETARDRRIINFAGPLKVHVPAI